MATKVSVVEPGRSASVWYDGAGWPSTRPGLYCPATTALSTSVPVIGLSAWSTLSFSSRTVSRPTYVGGSIATRQSSCSRWFWIMSRRAPEPS